MASKPHAIVFSKTGKTILDPSMRTVHTPPGLSVEQLLGLSAPSTGKACGASPLSLAPLGFGDENARS
jgi:hypothetical protein